MMIQSNLRGPEGPLFHGGANGIPYPIHRCLLEVPLPFADELNGGVRRPCLPTFSTIRDFSAPPWKSCRWVFISWIGTTEFGSGTGARNTSSGIFRTKS